MQKKSEKGKSDKKLPKLGIQPGHGGKPGRYPGRYYVRLNGQRTYLGYENGTGETPSGVMQSYLEAILKWQKNGCKPIPTRAKSGVSVESIAMKYLGLVESRCCKSHTDHCRVAMQFLIDHCGGISVDDFTRHTLKHLQEKLEQEGVTGRPFARPLINRYIGFIKTAFLEAEECGLCAESTVDSLSRFRPLKRGKTTAREYEPVDLVDTEVVKATLPFMSETIRAMVQVHLLCTMRSQDVINLRSCDIEMNDPKYPGVWWYLPIVSLITL
jgi:hypothetical protein